MTTPSDASQAVKLPPPSLLAELGDGRRVYGYSASEVRAAIAQDRAARAQAEPVAWMTPDEMSVMTPDEKANMRTGDPEDDGFADRHDVALVRAAAARAQGAGEAVDVEGIIRDIGELPDRTSPEDWPEALMATPDELRTIIRSHISSSQWISVGDARKPPGRKPILVAVEWMNYYEHEDGTPAQRVGYDVTEGEFIPKHGDRPDRFSSFAEPYDHDGWGITHWMPLPTAPGTDSVTAPTIPQAAEVPGFVPEGFWLAPMEPDEGMMSVASLHTFSVQWRRARDSWLARHPAAPTPTASAPKAEGEAEQPAETPPLSDHDRLALAIAAAKYATKPPSEADRTREGGDVVAKSCDTCLHASKPADSYPCRSCGFWNGGEPFDKWEAEPQPRFYTGEQES